MPLVSKDVTVAAGSTTTNLMTGTVYEYLDGNVGFRINASAQDPTTALTENDASDVVMNFSVNNADLTKDGAVNVLLSGTQVSPIDISDYTMNDTRTTPGTVRNQMIVTFTNNSAASRLVKFRAFIQN